MYTTSVSDPVKFFRIRITDPDLEIDLARIRISRSYKNPDRIRNKSGSGSISQ